MGLKWDNTGIAYNVELWKECLRVLKPRRANITGVWWYKKHTLQVHIAIEGRWGFKSRDCIMWIYGSKEYLDPPGIDKAIDKASRRRA